MTYSVESLVFRVAAGVVNTAARAANSLLEVMYPKDIGHIWEDVPAGSVASGGPAPTDPPSGGVADPAAEKVNPPDLSAAGSLSSSSSGVCDCTHLLHPGNVCAACGCNYSRLAATPTAQSLTEIYLGLSGADLWAAADCVDNWAASDNCDDNPYHQVRLQDLATRLRDASRNLRVNQ